MSHRIHTIPGRLVKSASPQRSLSALYGAIGSWPQSKEKPMKLAYTYDEHYGGGAKWESHGLKKWLTRVFDAPGIAIEPRGGSVVRKHVEAEFINNGWAPNVNLGRDSGLSVFAMRDALAFQLQTGNVSYTPYDLLKMGYLYRCKRIEAAALALPTRQAARIIGDNIAYSERVIKELKLFHLVITVPILVVAFE